MIYSCADIISVRHLISMIEKIRIFLPRSKFENKVYAASFLSMLAGFGWTVVLEDWQYFERSGSLVVIIVLSGLWSEKNERLANLQRIIEGNIANTKLKYSQSAINRLEKVDALQELDESKKHVESLVALAMQRFMYMEISFACLGTFVWGFGGLIGNLIWQFNT